MRKIKRGLENEDQSGLNDKVFQWKNDFITAEAIFIAKILNCALKFFDNDRVEVF